MQAVAELRTLPVRADREPLQARVRRYFRALDTLDADAVSSFFAVDATVRIMGVSPITGRAAIRKALVRFSLEADELRHDAVTLWTAGSLSVFDADVTLAVAAGTRLVFPATYSMRWADGMIQEACLNLYLESRMAVALSAFDRVRRPAAIPPRCA